MPPKQKHTPLPWFVYDDGDDVGASDIIQANDGEEKVDIAEMMTDDLPLDVQRANAAFIVRAVNSHEALLKAVKGAASYIRQVEGDSFVVENLDKAIAQAEGGRQ